MEESSNINGMFKIYSIPQLKYRASWTEPTISKQVLVLAYTCFEIQLDVYVRIHVCHL